MGRKDSRGCRRRGTRGGCWRGRCSRGSGCVDLYARETLAPSG